MQPIFITGIGTDVGKTVISAIVAEALDADYWKPVQAGFASGTDSEWVAARITHGKKRIHPETYKLAIPASPHISAAAEGVVISLDKIQDDLEKMVAKSTGVNDPGWLVIEGAGGLMVPLNEKEFILDLIKRICPKIILVSRNYLGSINHSLMTAAICKEHQLNMAGWIFNGRYLDYEEEIVQWTGLPKIASIPMDDTLSRDFIRNQASLIRTTLLTIL